MRGRIVTINVLRAHPISPSVSFSEICLGHVFKKDPVTFNMNCTNAKQAHISCKISLKTLIEIALVHRYLLLSVNLKNG